jgi:hypothetical protein
MSDATQIASPKARKRCAVYCRVSSDERLDQEFNSIDAQKEAGHAYVASHAQRDGFRWPTTTTTPASPAATRIGPG